MKREILVFGIILLFVGLAVSPSIYAYRDKVSLEPVADLDCDGELAFDDIPPGATLSRIITVENVGEDGSLLDWEIESFPDWGTWTFDPVSGIGLQSGDSTDIEVTIIAPDEPLTVFDGELVLVNSDNASDYCILNIMLKIEHQNIVSFVFDGYTPIQLVFLLINKLRYYDVEDEAEINSIIEEIESYSCGCEDTTLDWSFPVVCTLLFPIFAISFLLAMINTQPMLFIEIMMRIGLTFNCFWAWDS